MLRNKFGVVVTDGREEKTVFLGAVGEKEQKTSPTKGVTPRQKNKG